MALTEKERQILKTFEEVLPNLTEKRERPDSVYWRRLIAQDRKTGKGKRPESRIGGAEKKGGKFARVYTERTV